MDLKMNNMVYNEETNILKLIDFNLSVNKRIPENAPTFSETRVWYEDISNILKGVFLNIIIISLANTYLYDEMNNSTNDINDFLREKLPHMIKFTSLLPEDKPLTYDDVTNFINKKLHPLMEKVNALDETKESKYTLTEKKMEPVMSPGLYIGNLPRKKVSQDLDRLYKSDRFMREEQSEMARQDTRKGGRHKRRNKKTKKYQFRSFIFFLLITIVSTKWRYKTWNKNRI